MPEDSELPLETVAGRVKLRRQTDMPDLVKNQKHEKRIKQDKD